MADINQPIKRKGEKVKNLRTGIAERFLWQENNENAETDQYP